MIFSKPFYFFYVLSLQMKDIVKQYAIFFVMGIVAWMSWWCIITQSNYWRHFYGSSTLTVINMVTNIMAVLSGFAMDPCQRRFATRKIATIWFIIGLISNSLFVLFGFTRVFRSSGS